MCGCCSGMVAVLNHSSLRTRPLCHRAGWVRTTTQLQSLNRTITSRERCLHYCPLLQNVGRCQFMIWVAQNHFWFNTRLLLLTMVSPSCSGALWHRYPAWLTIDQPSHHTIKSHSQEAPLKCLHTVSPALPTPAAVPVYLLTLPTPFSVSGELIHSPLVTGLSTLFLECQHELESLALNRASRYGSEKLDGWK